MEHSKPTSLKFGLRAWAVWDAASDAIIRSWSEAATQKVPGELRRRITPVGRKCLECGWLVTGQAGVPPKIVLASRHGEFTRTFDLLQSIDQGEDVSPADFSLSVHHALLGLLSIVTGNRGGHIAVAAGQDSLGFGFVEAATSLAEAEQPVLLLYFDEVLPEFFNGLIDQPHFPQALALLLDRPSGLGGRGVIDVSFSTSGQVQSDCSVFAEFLVGRRSHAAWAGDRHDWRVAQHDSAAG